MDWARVQRAKAVFEEVIDHPTAERAVLIEQLCGGDSALRAEVDDLLLAVKDEDYLSVPLPDRMRTLLEGPCGPRQIIGKYSVLKFLGRGGTASVHLAERSDGLYQRPVAVKLLDRVASSPEIEKRFHRELSALSRLEHPNIVGLLDGGLSAEGFFYIVTEYVAGTRLDLHCAEHGLSIEERLRLFIAVCDAVSFAHRHLVVHRDLKPSNILVTPQGIVKLLDFGVVKLLDEEQSERLTTTGNARMTLEYASPEQISGGRVSTESDVYSLGVVLYELLTGHLPYADAGRGPHQLIRAIIEEEPVDAANLNRELKAILSKALRKEPEDRYGSVDYLRDDIERYLNGLPLAAHPSGHSYRLKKFIQRHRLVVTATAVIFVTLVGGVMASAYYALKAERRLMETRSLADQVLWKIGTELWQTTGASTALGIIDQNRAEYLEKISNESPNDWTLRRELLKALFYLGKRQGDTESGVSSMSNTGAALATFKKALVVAEELHEKFPKRTDDSVYLTHVLNFLGKLLVDTASPREAIQHYRRAISIMEAFLPGDLAKPDIKANYAHSQALLASALLADGKTDEALILCESSVRTRETILADEPQSGLRRKGLVLSLLRCGAVLSATGNHLQALSYFRRAMSIEDKAHAASAGRSRPTEWSVARTHELVGRESLHLNNVKEGRKRIEEAVSLYRKLANEEPGLLGSKRDLAEGLGSLVLALERAGNAGSALEVAQEQLSLLKEITERDPASVRSKANLSTCHRTIKQLEGHVTQ